MNWPKLVAKLAVFALVVAAIGFVVTMVLNAFVLERYNAYGEVPIPGSASLWLPAGEVTMSFHTRVIGSPSGGGLPVPEIGMTITGPAGVPTPTVTEDIGTTVSVNTDSRRRVGSVAVPVGGDYTIRTQGQVGGFISPRLAFGRTSPYGFLVWVFAGVFGGALLTLIGAARWSARRPRVVPSETAPTTEATYTPDAEGVRLAQLKTIAALRDSGALTDAEFRAEKRRILKGR